MAVLGFEGTLTVNGVNPGFRNLRFGYSHTEVDVTTNLDKGSKAYAKGLFDKFISGEILLDDSDSCATVLAAVQSRDPVPVSATLGTGATAITISGNMFVFGSEVSADLDNAASMTITCRPAPANAQEG